MVSISIARRLQDPLSEYVKIGPSHLGVGMYQHDVSETKLAKTLENIVMECVSFVGKHIFFSKLKKEFFCDIFKIVVYFFI